MSLDIFEEKTKEADLEVFEIIKMLKKSDMTTPEFLNGVLINFERYSALMERLRRLRYNIGHLYHVFIGIQGREAEQRTSDFVMKLIKGDLVIPALEEKK